MPQSAIEAGASDFVLPPDEIAKSLVQIIDERRHNHKFLESALTPESNSASELATIFALVRREVGVDMTLYKLPTLSRRIDRRVKLLNLGTLSEYIEHLEAHPAEVKALYNDMLINVTHMFRDKATVKLLKNKVLPALLAQGTKNQHIRIWVAGCASGEEAYTLAIICREFLDHHSLSVPVQIFATDLSASAIAQARGGLYAADVLAAVSKERLQQFFTREGDKYRVTQSIREMCIFAQHNLLVDPPFSQLDIVSCCNVLIYFKPSSQQKLLNTFHYALKPHGFLVLGSSETAGASRALFSPLTKTNKIYRRKAVVTQPHLNLNSGISLRTATGTVRPSTERSQGEFDISTLADKILLTKFAPSSVVIDNDMEIVRFQGMTNAYLTPAPGRATLNVLKMARPGLALYLRKALREVKQTQTTYQNNVVIKQGKKSKTISLEVLPLTTTPAQPLYYLIVFKEISEKLAPGSQKIKEKLNTLDSRSKDDQILQLDTELTEMQEEMKRISEEYEATNEELQLSNEELRSANEELQTLNEELETSSEELASSNEELVTLNQALSSSNDQLRAARDFAEAIIRTVRESLVVLGPDLRIRTANDSFYQTFSASPEMTEGQFIYDLGNGQWRIPELESLLENILPKDSHSQNYAVTHDFPGIGTKIMLLDARRIQMDSEGGEYMILLAIEDITEQKEAIARTQELEAATAALTEQQNHLLALNAAKDEFIMLASHQLRTPATIVKQYIGMLLDGYAGTLTTPQLKLLHIAHESNDRQLRIVSDLLNIAQLDAGKVQLEKSSCDLQELLKDIVAGQMITFTQRNQHVVFVPPKKKININVDKELIHMAIENILDNASKYSRNGESITISIKEIDGSASICIKDNGVGLHDDDLKKLFQKFVRVENKFSVAVGGSGLGLYWAKNIIELHEGAIEVMSKINHGSTFTIKLPIVKI